MASETSAPLISIVVPTRDRPEFAALALNALARQSFRNFEVILSDNALRRPFVAEPRLLDDSHMRLVRPPSPSWMTDHWEFAVTQARGRYIGVLGDKSVLVPNALEQIASVIQRHSPDALSWRHGTFQPADADPAGRGVVAARRHGGECVRVDPKDILKYLLATYMDPDFVSDHQLEIRGSIYHGLYSAALLQSLTQRFGRVFRYYAPDLNAQCAAMRVARTVMHVHRPLELVIVGPSNGVAVGVNVSHILRTQEEARQGASGSSVPLIANLSTSISHLLASDLIAVSGATVRDDQRIGVHVRAARDLCRLANWPNAGFKSSQWHALRNSAAHLGPEARRRVMQEAWRRPRIAARAFLAVHGRSLLGSRMDDLQKVLGRQDPLMARTSVEHVFAALDEAVRWGQS